MRTVLRTIGAALMLASSAWAQDTRRLSRPIEFWNPAWSPDGRTLVFESTLSGKYSIYTIRANGSGLTRLTVDTANNEQPRWSPDGKEIVFSSDRAGAGLDIYVMNADGSGKRRVGNMPSGGWYQSSFSPDGQWIAFQGRLDNKEVRDRVYVMRTDGSGKRLLSDSLTGAEGPRWSEDGKAVEFTRVPYPVRYWDQMGPVEMKSARSGERRVAVLLDGGTREPKPATDVSYGKDIPSSAKKSSNGRTLAYEKAVDGWNGIYAYDIIMRKETLLVGGPGAGPLGYLRTAKLAALTDTLDTYESPKSGGAIVKGNGAFVIRTLKGAGNGRWEFADTWFDAAGKQTARQAARTASNSLVTEIEYTRANTDSASMSYSKDRSTGWVVPGGKGPQLFDSASTGERYAGFLVISTIAKSKPAIGDVFVAPGGALYGGNPLATRVDTIRVVRRDTLFAKDGPHPALVLGRGSSEVWMDESTGSQLLGRGNAGPERYWWHIKRGITPPAR
jgi:hypothetical protein